MPRRTTPVLALLSSLFLGGTTVGQTLDDVLTLVPEDAAGFKGGYHRRRRFAKRFRIGMRKKSNVKNKTWEQTE